MTKFFIGFMCGVIVIDVATLLGEQKYSDQVKECIKEERQRVNQYDVMASCSKENLVMAAIISAKPYESCEFIMKEEKNKIKGYRIQCTEYKNYP